MFWVIVIAAVVIAAIVASNNSGCTVPIVIIVCGIFVGFIATANTDKAPVANVAKEAPRPPPDVKKKSWTISFGKQPKEEVKTAETPVQDAPTTVIASAPEPKEWKMPTLPVLFSVGSYLFLLFIAIELIGLGILMNYEKGLYVLGVLVLSLVFVYGFTDATISGSYLYWSTHRWLVYPILGTGFLIGMFWMFIRWDLYGKSRTGKYKGAKVEWLREHGVMTGAEIPEHLLEEWLLYVKGDPGGADVGSHLQDSRRAWLRDTYFAEDLSRAEPSVATLGERRRHGRNVNVAVSTEVPPEAESEWVKFAVEDPLLSSGTIASREMQDARKTWLKANGVYDTHIIPPEYRERFRRRVLPNHYVVRQPHPVLFPLSQTPSAWKMAGKLASWWGLWFIDMPVFFLKDMMVEGILFLVRSLRAILQGRMDAIYAPVHNDFRAPSDVDKD